MSVNRTKDQDKKDKKKKQRQSDLEGLILSIM